MFVLLKRKVYAHCFSAFCWLNRYPPPQLFLMFSNLFAVSNMVPFPPVSFLASCLFPHLSTVRPSLVSIDQHITKLYKISKHALIFHLLLIYSTYVHLVSMIFHHVSPCSTFLPLIFHHFPPEKMAGEVCLRPWVCAARLGPSIGSGVAPLAKLTNGYG